MLLAIAVAVLLMAGCASNKQLLLQQQSEIDSLSSRLNEKEEELERERARAAELRAELDKSLADFSEREHLYLEQIEEKTIITLPGEVLFSSSSTRLSSSGKDVLDRIADVIRGYPDREVLIEGHTDDVQIAIDYRDKYPSNWELSSARAQSVLRYFLSEHGLPGERVAAIGRGEYKPVADNDSPEGRAMNRRVVIHLGPMQGESQPVLP